MELFPCLLKFTSNAVQVKYVDSSGIYPRCDYKLHSLNGYSRNLSLPRVVATVWSTPMICTMANAETAMPN